MYTEFIEWYTELYGGKVPKGKDLYDFMEAKLGKVQRGRFKGYRLIHSFEQDLDVTPNKGKKRDLRAAMSNAFGFGGTNASVIFQKV